MKSKQFFLLAAILLGILAQAWGADILRPRLAATKSWPLGNDIQGGVSVPAGKYLNLPAAGPLPLNPYTGNATRIVTDISAVAVGEIPLVWQRYNNTRATPGSEDVGSEGNWRHSYQWDFSYTPANLSVVVSPWQEPQVFIPPFSDGLGKITVVYPDGTVNSFTETGVFSGVFVCASGEVTDYIKISGSENISKLAAFNYNYSKFDLITSENSRYGFGSPVQNSFRLDSITDSKVQVTTLAYGNASNGQVILKRVTEPGGRYLDVQFSPFSFTTKASGPLSPAKTISQFFVTKVVTSDNRTVNFGYTSRTYGSVGYKAYSLTKASYPDGKSAVYSYSPQNTKSSGASLLTARDTKSGGIPNVKYTYWAAQSGFSPPPAGSVKAVAELDSGVKLCEIGLVASENNSNEPVAFFIDGSGFSYSVNPGSKGLLGTVRNIDDATSQVVYDLTGGNRKTTSKNSKNQSLATTRSSLGKILSRTWPKVGAQTNTPTETWTYNTDGYLKTYKDQRNNQVIITRNGKNLTTKVLYPDGTFENFIYGDFNQIASHKLRNGKTENFTYYAGGVGKGLLKTSVDAAEGKTTYTYNSNNLVDTVTDPAGRVVKFDYDKNGAVTKITYPPAVAGGAVSTKVFTYDPRGNLLTTTNELGKIWTNTYDEYNRVLTVKTPMNRITTYKYDPNAPNNRSPIEVKLPSGKKIAYTYTAGWGYKVETMTSAPGTAEAAVTTYGYDDNGNVTSVKDPLDHVTTLGYDERQRLSYAIDPANSRSDFEYDDADNLKVQTTPDGTTTNVFDAMNRLIQSTEPGNRITKMTYDAFDAVATHTDPENNVYKYTYDNVGRVTTLLYPDNTKEVSAYNPAGDLKQFTTRAKKIQAFTYDGKGRQTKAEWNDGITPTVNSGYDAANRLTSIGNSNSVVTYGYNDADELLSETQAITGMTAAKLISYVANADGQAESMTYPDGTKIEYGYNQRGGLETIKQAGVTLSSYTYNDAGSRITTTRANGVGTTLTYDDLQRLTSIQDVAPVPTAGTVQQKFSYGYDAMSRRKYAKGAGSTGDVYDYDTEGQLKSVLYGAANPDTTPVSPLRTVSYTYDKAGNRKSLADKLSSEATPFQTTYVANKNNQYSSVGVATMSYDGAGNLSGYSETSSGSTRKTSSVYNADNRLISAINSFDATGFAQAYDPLGRCVKRIENGVTTYLVNDRDWHLLSEYDASGAQKARYVAGADVDEILSRTESSGRVLYYHTDGLGSVTKLTDVNGSVVESYSYDVFGNPTIFDQSGATKWISPVGNRFLFTGREYLYSLGVYDYRARIYDPYLGRFWQPDPIGHGGDGVNIYRYCGNDPVNNTDPSGLDYISMPYSFPDLVSGLTNLGYTDISIEQLIWVNNPPNIPNASANFHGSANLSIYSSSAGAYRYYGGAAAFENQRKADHKEESTWRKVAGFVPVVGSGLDAYDAFSEGRWGMGILHTALAATDLIGAGAIVKMAAKGVAKIAAKEVAEMVIKEACTVGGCFVDGTEIATEDGERSIESLEVGERVLTKDGLSSTDVDPSSWRRISLSMQTSGSSSGMVKLEILRPLSWLDANGCKVGAEISFEMEEMGLRGLAEVREIGDCPVIKPGQGHVILATVTHENTNVVELNLNNGNTALRPTAGHLIYSVTREDWIPAGELRPGEELQTIDGTARVTSIASLDGKHRVYNFEIESDHNYYAGGACVLSHNMCMAAAKKITKTVVEEAIIHGNSLKSKRATWAYKLFDNTGKFLKNGITSRLLPERRYTKAFMQDKYMETFLYPDRLSAYGWEAAENIIGRGPLNLNGH